MVTPYKARKKALCGIALKIQKKKVVENGRKGQKKE